MCDKSFKMCSIGTAWVDGLHWRLSSVTRNVPKVNIYKHNLQRYISNKRVKPLASEVLTCYLQQCNEPPWTSYFIKYSSVQNDQWGWSHFNWKAGNSNYHILRTGCYPYIKYHCSRRPHQDLREEDLFFRLIKTLNLGIPCLAYGIAALLLIRHQEIVHTPHGDVLIYFLYKEDKGSQY